MPRPQTQREHYLAKIEASNLIREIGQTLMGENAPCRRIPPGYQFAALVGHDTNIASVASLLHLNWQFNNAPPERADFRTTTLFQQAPLFLSCGANEMTFLCGIFYAAQDLQEMREFTGGSCPAFRLPVRCDPLQHRAGYVHNSVERFQRSRRPGEG